MKKKSVFLPRCVTKLQLVNYFGCSYAYLWANVITEDLLEEWGCVDEDLDRFKSAKVIGPKLTRKIYVHFRITDLHSDYSQEISSEIHKLTQAGQASSDIALAS